MHGRDVGTGYGYAGYNIVRAMQKNGLKVPFNDPAAAVMFNFCQPQDYKKYRGQYGIGYTPWESTALKPGWLKMMSYMDEIWTTSPLIAEWYENAGVEGPVRVYEHGIDHIWAPQKRVRGQKLRFLHVGEPAPRKCGQMVVDEFIKLFGDDPRYHLTIKAAGYQTTRINPVAGVLGPPSAFYKNITVITDELPVAQLVSLFHQHHVLIYPSWGEGFGFIPLQGMASGMPVIMNTSWAPYKRFSVGLEIQDRLVKTPWPDIHPGMMFEPSRMSLRMQMEEAAENFEYYSDKSFEVAEQIHEEYDWQRVTKKAFAPIVEKFL